MEIAPVHDEQHRRRLAVLTESLTQALEQVDVTIPKDFYGYIVERTSREVCKDVWEVGQCGVWSAELYEHKVLFHSWGFISKYSILISSWKLICQLTCNMQRGRSRTRHHALLLPRRIKWARHTVRTS